MARPINPVKVDAKKTRFTLNVWYSADLLGECDLTANVRIVVLSKTWLAQYNEFKYDLHVMDTVPATRLLDRDRRIMAFMIPDHVALLALADTASSTELELKKGIGVFDDI